MTKLGKNISAALAMCAMLAAISGCKKEGPVERAGKEVDQAVDNAGEKIEKTGENIKDAVKDDKK